MIFKRQDEAANAGTKKRKEIAVFLTKQSPAQVPGF